MERISNRSNGQQTNGLNSFINEFERVLLVIKSKSWSSLTRHLFVHTFPFWLVGRPYYYLRLRYPFFYWRNYHSIVSHKKEKTELSELQQQTVDQLREDGVADFRVEELLPENVSLDDLIDYSKDLLNSPGVRAQINQRKSKSDQKWSVVRCFGRNQTKLKIPPIFADIFLNEKLLVIANNYLGQRSKLNYVDVWYNVPADKEKGKVSSEYWHRDHEDKAIVKVFIYLSDVDTTMGPLHFLKKTHTSGAFSNLFPSLAGRAHIPPPKEIEQEIERRKIEKIVCVGEKGTVLLCDTVGFHRRGDDATNPRTVLVGCYTSDSGLDRNWYQMNDKEDEKKLSELQRHALS